MRHAAALCLVLAAACAPPAGGEPAFDERERSWLRACVAHLERVGGAEDEEPELALECSNVSRLLADARLAARVGMDDVEVVTRGQLEDLASLAEGFAPRVEEGVGARLDHAGLEALLSEVLAGQERVEGWWPRLKQWLKERFDPRGDAFDGLDEWLRGFDLPDWVASLVLEVTVVLILALALLVVVNEVRAGGWRWGKRTPRASAGSGAAASDAPEARPPMPEGAEAACLRATIERLAGHDLVSLPVNGRSNEELARDVHRHDPVLGALFASLARAVDAIVFGDAPREPSRLDGIARRIAERLDGSTRAGT